MVTEEEEIEETVTRTRTYYKCDKCYGRNHDETRFEEDLNKVVGEHEYLLCDDCMERAYEYLRDFF